MNPDGTMNLKKQLADKKAALKPKYIPYNSIIKNMNRPKPAKIIVKPTIIKKKKFIRKFNRKDLLKAFSIRKEKTDQAYNTLEKKLSLLKKKPYNKIAIREEIKTCFNALDKIETTLSMIKKKKPIKRTKKLRLNIWSPNPKDKIDQRIVFGIIKNDKSEVQNTFKVTFRRTPENSMRIVNNMQTNLKVIPEEKIAQTLESSNNNPLENIARQLDFLAKKYSNTKPPEQTLSQIRFEANRDQRFSATNKWKKIQEEHAIKRELTPQEKETNEGIKDIFRSAIAREEAKKKFNNKNKEKNKGNYWGNTHPHYHQNKK